MTVGINFHTLPTPPLIGLGLTGSIAPTLRKYILHVPLLLLCGAYVWPSSPASNSAYSHRAHRCDPDPGDWLVCSFASCTANPAGWEEMSELMTHEDREHAVWICDHKKCRHIGGAFESAEGAASHAVTRRHYGEDGQSLLIFRRWVLSAQPPVDEGPFFVLPQHLPAASTPERPLSTEEDPSKELSTLVADSIIGHLAAARSSLAAAHPRLQPNDLARITHAITELQQTLPFSSPAATPRHVHFPLPIRSNTDLPATPSLSPPSPPPPVTREPPLTTSISPATQQTYYTHLNSLCLSACFTFYTTHRPHLHSITDRKHNRIIPDIHTATQITLPMWTHYLRRLSDARGLVGKVSRPESFNGDIQPADEVHHALVKRKRKGDREVLALVMVVRGLCAQLRLWGMCKDVDEFYGVVEEAVGEAGGRRGRRVETWGG